MARLQDNAKIALSAVAMMLAATGVWADKTVGG